MVSKGDHLEYIAHMGLFTIDCSRTIFTQEEIYLLEKWGHWFSALVSGDLKPFTEAQERFIKVMRGELNRETPEEIAWHKYMGRKAAQKKFNLDLRYETEHDTFYSREDKKKISSITMSILSKIHYKGLTEQ